MDVEKSTFDRFCGWASTNMPTIPMLDSYTDWAVSRFFEPKLDPKKLPRHLVTSKEGKIITYAGEGTDLVLFEYRGQDAAAKARDSAQKIEAAYLSGEFDRSPLEVNEVRSTWWGSHGEVSLNDSWVSDTILIDLAGEGLPPENERKAMTDFMIRLHTVGFIPSEKERAKLELARFSDNAWIWLVGFRDTKLNANLEKATLFMAVDDYDQLKKTAYKTFDFKLSVSSRRPIGYDEMVFLYVDSLRIRAIKERNIDYLSEAMELLEKNRQQLGPDEKGYHIRYPYELLGTCALKQEIFADAPWTGLAACSPDATAGYYRDGTFGYNTSHPLFYDNFLGMRTYLTRAKEFKLDLDRGQAKKQYEKALELLDLLKVFSSVTKAASFWPFIEMTADNDYEALWQRLEPYATQEGRTWEKDLHDLIGPRAALWFFGLYGAITAQMKTHLPVYARAIGIPNPDKQFEVDSFPMFAVQAYLGLGRIEKEIKHPDKSRAYLEKAHETANILKEKGGAAFASGKQFEERVTFYQTELYYAASFILDKPKDQAKAKAILTKIVEELKNDELNLLTLLNAQYLLGIIAKDDKNLAEAKKLFLKVLDAIAQEEKKVPGRELTIPFQELRANVKRELQDINREISR